MLVASAFPAPIAPVRAEDRGRELVPEVNAFIKLSDRSRLYLLGSVTRELRDSVTDGEIGAHLDLTLKPILRPELREANWERERYLWMRVGYVRSGSIDGRNDGFSQHLGLIEATARVALPGEVWLANRVRMDLRDVDGNSSKRYRYRLAIEREFTAGGVVLVPYAQAETFYDTRFDAWNRQLYQAGVEIELSKQWRLEPYLARQNDKRSPSANLDRVGLVLKYYR
jgi:hypothetical protein